MESRLTTDTQFCNEFTIAFDIFLCYIVEQATTLTNEHLKSASRCKVFAIAFEVLCKVGNTVSEKSNLALYATRVSSRLTMFFEDFFLLCLV